MTNDRMFEAERSLRKSMTLGKIHTQDSVFCSPANSRQQELSSVSDSGAFALSPPLRARYARRAGVSAFPFRGAPFDLPVNSDEGGRLPSSLFQGRQNP
jgi:hypothetical protein